MTTDLCLVSGVKNGDKAQKTVAITLEETTIHVDVATLITTIYVMPCEELQYSDQTSSTAITIELHA